MANVMAAGDTHGDMDQARALIKWAKRHEEGVDLVWQVGDFGYSWPGEGVERRLPRLLQWIAESGIPWYFNEGNHDNYEWLKELGAWRATEPVEVAPGLTYVPRGVVVEVDGCRLMAMGGGVSIDRRYRASVEEVRTMGYGPDRVSWWPEEVITDEDVERCLANGEVDVLMSHDSPNNLGLTEYLEEFSRHYRLEYKLDAISKANREKMDRIVDGCRPGAVFHGHYHHRYNATLPSGTQVYGLDRDGTGVSSYAIFDTELYKARA